VSFFVCLIDLGFFVLFCFKGSFCLPFYWKFVLYFSALQCALEYIFYVFKAVFFLVEVKFKAYKGIILGNVTWTH